MKYDTTGPVRVNETRSLLALISLVGVVAVGAGLMMHFGGVGERRASTGQETSATRPAGAITHVNAQLTVVKTRGVLVEIRENDGDVWVSRGPPVGDPATAKQFQLARVLEAIARNPAVAKRYGATAIAPRLQRLNLRPPQLTVYQRDRVRDLFLAAEDATGPAREQAEGALVEAVGQMGMSAGELAAFNAEVERGKALLTPAQLALIRSGGRRPATSRRPVRPAKGAGTRAASRPGGNPAKATTHPGGRADAAGARGGK